MNRKKRLFRFCFHSDNRFVPKHLRECWIASVFLFYPRNERTQSQRIRFDSWRTARRLSLPAAAGSRRPTQANAHIVHMHGASQRPKYTNTHMHIHTYTHACIVCILGVSIFWRHYPMYFINSSSSSSARGCQGGKCRSWNTHTTYNTQIHTHSASTTREQRAPSTAIVIIVSKIIIVAIC